MPFFRCYSPSPYSYFAQQNCYLRKEEEVEATSDVKEANSSSSSSFSSSTSSDDNECCDNSISSNENASSNASRCGLQILITQYLKKQSTYFPEIQAVLQRIQFNYNLL